MRWFSGENSVKRGEASVLAIVETALAISLSVWIAVHFDTVKYIVMGACVAPLLLLRTDASMRRAFSLFNRIPTKKLNAFLSMILVNNIVPNRLIRGLFFIFASMSLSVSLVIVRAIATVEYLVRQPGVSVQAFRENWWSTIFCIDSVKSPSLLPVPSEGLPAIVHDEDIEVYKMFKVKVADWRGALLLPVFIIGVALLTFPAFVYRWSLKSTAVVWLPLLWMVRPIGPKEDPLKTRLQLLLKSDGFRLVVGLSTIAIMSLLAKVVLMVKVAEFAEWWNGSPLLQFAAISVSPAVTPIWQLAMGFNSLLALGLLFYVRAAVRRIDAGASLDKGRVERVLDWSFFVRRLLSSYTIACTLYLYIREASEWDLPRIGNQLFPWT